MAGGGRNSARNITSSISEVQTSKSHSESAYTPFSRVAFVVQGSLAQPSLAAYTCVKAALPRFAHSCIAQRSIACMGYAVLPSVAPRRSTGPPQASAASAPRICPHQTVCSEFVSQLASRFSCTPNCSGTLYVHINDKSAFCKDSRDIQLN